jgi:uncharacterized membrane protein YgcG
MGTAAERVASQPGVAGGSRLATAIFNKKVLAGALVVALIAGALYWFLAGSEALAAMTVRADSGSVEVIRGGEAMPVDGNLSLRAGDIVSTASGSVATLRLDGPRRIEMRASTEIKVLSGTAFDSLDGRVLATSGARMEAGIGDVSVTTSSATFRIDNMTAARTGVYEGRVAVDGPGSVALTIPALFQTSITGGRVLGREPYALNESDLWDSRILDRLVAIEDGLGQVKQGFATQLGGSRPNLAYFDSLTNKNVGFLKPYLAPKRLNDEGYTADLMVAFMVAIHSPGSPEKAFERAYELFFEHDGTWGIVAGIVMRNNDDRLKRFTADIEDAFLGTGVLAESNGGEPDFALPAESGSGSGGTGGSAGGSGGGGFGGGGSSSGGGVPPGGGGSDQPPSGGGGDDGGGDDGSGDDDNNNNGGNDSGDCIECAVEDILPSPPPAPKPPPLGGN